MRDTCYPAILDQIYDMKKEAYVRIKGQENNTHVALRQLGLSKETTFREIIHTLACVVDSTRRLHLGTSIMGPGFEDAEISNLMKYTHFDF